MNGSIFFRIQKSKLSRERVQHKAVMILDMIFTELPEDQPDKCMSSFEERSTDSGRARAVYMALVGGTSKP